MNDGAEVASPSPKQIGRYRRLLRAVLNQLLGDLPSVKFDKCHHQHLAMVCIFATIIQSVEECYRLLSKPTVTVPGTIRSVLESYADLCAVTQNASYTSKMLATFYDQQIQHLKSMLKSPGNQYHADVARHIDPAMKKIEITAELHSLKEQGHTPLKLWQRFAEGNLTSIYESAYWPLCLEGHNNVVVLEQRHIRKTGEDYEVEMYRPNTTEDLARYYDTLTAILIDSSRRVYATLGHPLTVKYQGVIKSFDAFRALVHPTPAP
jgi:hypothetical protein